MPRGVLGRRYVVLDRYEERPDDVCLAFTHEAEVVRFLTPFLRDVFDREILRALACDGEPPGVAALRPDEGVLHRVAQRLAAGEIRLRPRALPLTGGGTRQEEAEPPRPAPMPRAQEEDEVDFWVRLDIDPNQASTFDDRFILTSSDGSYRSEKTVKDDKIPGDASVDLHYAGLKRSKSYTLRVQTAAGTPPDTIFENLSYGALSSFTGAEPASSGAAVDEGEDPWEKRLL